MKRFIVLTVLAVALTLLLSGTAFAYTDYVPYLNKQTTGTTTTYNEYALGCFWCHGWEKWLGNNPGPTVDLTRVVTAPAGTLHPTEARGTNLAAQFGQPYGPHGGYSNTTDRCKVCHDMHAAAGDKRLLPGATVADLCETCHDFTEGISIYGAIRAETGAAPEGGHWIAGLASSENSSTVGVGQNIPGGVLGRADAIYPQTGGTTEYISASLAGTEGNLTCTDCHTPHGNTSMTPFRGDRVRLGSAIIVAATLIQPVNINQITIPAATAAVLNAGAAAIGNANLITDWPAGGLSETVPTVLTIDASTMPIVVDVLQIVGEVPNTLPRATLIAALDADIITGGLKINPTTDWGLELINRTPSTTHIPYSGVALAVQLYLAGALDVRIGIHGLEEANLVRVASNKLLRDVINGVDLRHARFGGTEVQNATVPNSASGVAGSPTVWNNGVYDTTNSGVDMIQAVAPNVNGQGGAVAVYGSGFCFGCHKGRLGNHLGGASTPALQANFDQAYLTSISAGTESDTALNHPVNMGQAYQTVGNLIKDEGLSAALGVGQMAGLALSNAGFVFEPVIGNVAAANALGAGHPDGNIARPFAPMCQQCHEDSRNVEAAFSYGDTDKSIPFTSPVNNALGYANSGAGNPGSFIYAGNPQFQNFPHETNNYRLLVEGGDSNRIGGGNNDDLCLNCHVPGSTIRDFNFTDPQKDLNGFME